MDEPSRMMTTQDESLRKAAMLIASLEGPTSDALLKSIGGEAAACLREISIDRESLTDDQRSRILYEFLRAGEIEAARTRDAEGVEIEVSLAAKLASELATSGLDDPPENPPKSTIGRQAHPPSRLVGEEKPEVAVNEPHAARAQPKSLAAPSGKPAEHREASPLRMAASAPASPQPSHARCSNSSARVPVAFEFDDLHALPDHALAMVFQRAEPRVALIALTGANPRLLERIQRQLPWQQGRELRRQIERLGPVRLSDVEHAQRKLAETTAELIQDRIICPPKNRRFTTAA
ncbi:MAG: hypothetical protein EA424_02290 [Planctomycetaceae bacterium]|nr:MAG: hypothetical protein EA424_02290 [Planctomycetaceae bacterium]